MGKKKITAEMVVKDWSGYFLGNKEDFDEDLAEKYLLQPISDLPLRISIAMRALELFDELVIPYSDIKSELNSMNHCFVAAIADAAYFAKGSRKR